jgi:hypothetical protein
MKFHRIENPASPNEFQVATLLENEVEVVILQFSRSDAYDANVLGKIDLMCKRFGSRLNVRFYGHYGSEFDGLALRYLPSVRSLNIDCVMTATHLEALDDLAYLEEFAFGVFEANIPFLLKSRALTQLRRLVLASTRKNNIDLAPLASYTQLKELFINGHTNHIEAISNLSGLQKLSLGGIGKNKSLSFVKSVKSLKSLTYILGGRLNMGDLANEGLERLEILRVLGLSEIDLALFPNLQRLTIEDQLRLEELDIRPLQKLQRLSIFNCKKLTHLIGISSARSLESLRIGQTGVALDEVLNHLPANVKALTLHSPRKAVDDEVQLRIASLGLPSAYYTGAP